MGTGKGISLEKLQSMLTDTHAHLTAPELYPEIDRILKNALSAEVNQILNIATNSSELETGLKLIETSYPWIYQAAAVHPHDASSPDSKAYFEFIQKCAENNQLIAIGETGLDYHYHHSTPEEQQYFLRRHLQLANQHHLPALIHCREAFADFYKIVDEEQKSIPIVLHCFTGTEEEAQEAIKRGFYISFSGIITFKKSEELRRIAKTVPDHLLFIETDAPFLAPQSQRGKKNEPAFVREVAEVLAALKGISLVELAALTTGNFKKMIGR